MCYIVNLQEAQVDQGVQKIQGSQFVPEIA